MITLKTNGYEVSRKTMSNVYAWEAFLIDKFGEENIRDIEVFFYTERFAFCDVYLKNKSYGQFGIAEFSVRFNGHMCTRDEYKIFNDATFNDECGGNKLFEDRH